MIRSLKGAKFNCMGAIKVHFTVAPQTSVILYGSIELHFYALI